jgi:HEAT repeat protein
MATGGIPMARVFVILVLVAVPAALITIDHPASAQEATSLLKKGLEELRAGKHSEAMATLRQALAADPSNEEVMNALGRAEYEALLGLIASGQEGANMAKALLDRAMPILPAKAFNQRELDELVKKAVTAEDYTDRFDAQMTLARTYGEFAVPGLVNYLSSSNTETRIAAHIALSRRIGRDAVVPLTAALHSKDPNVRRLICAQLGMIGDERAVPALAGMTELEKDANVKKAASAALAKLVERFPHAAGMEASALFERLAGLYYAGDYSVLSYSDRPLVMWRWGEDGLVGLPVPRHLYVLKLAEDAAYHALFFDANNAGAAALLARILASERLSSDIMGAVNDDDLTKQYAAGLESAAGTAAALGWNTLAQAVSEALNERDHTAAAFLLDIMPAVYASSDFTSDNPVVRATDGDAANVRFAAAEAVLRFNGMRRVTAFPDPDGFIGRVAKAVGESIPRQILVVDGSDERRNKMLTELNNAKFTAFDARTGSDGVVRGLRYSGLDLIIISVDLVDMEALAMIAKLQAEDRTKDIPVVVVGTSKQVANEEWRGLYEGKVKAMAGIPEGPGLASEEFIKIISGAFEGESPSAAARYRSSSSVLDALASTDTDNALFNWNALTPTLTALLGADLPSDPPVRLNAIRAMGNVGDSAAIAALLDFFGSTDDDALRAAAGMAIGDICQAGDVTLDAKGFDALLKGTGSDSADVRKSAFAALGSANLTAEQSIKVAITNRPGVAAGE